MQSAALIFGGTVDGTEPMSNVVRSGNTVTFSSPSIPSFTGAISSDGSTISARGLDPSSAMVFKRVDATGAALQPTSSASNTTTSPTQSSGGTPSFYQVDGIEIAPEDRPAGPLDLTYASEEEALAAAEARERQAAQDELARQQNELEAQRVMESNAPVREETTTDLRPIPVGEPRFSGVAGHVGQNKRTLDLRDQFLHQIAWFESSDSPCRIAIAGLDVASETQLDVGCPRNIRPFGLFLSDQSRSVELTDSVIGSIAVCNNNPRALYNEALRLKGIRVSGERIADDGTTTYIPASDEDSLRNCAVWSIPNLCPVNPTHLATGLIVHSNDSGSTGDNEDIVGLQLICRQVGLR